MTAVVRAIDTRPTDSDASGSGEQMEELRATLASVAELARDGLLTVEEAARMKEDAMADFRAVRHSECHSP